MISEILQITGFSILQDIRISSSIEDTVLCKECPEDPGIDECYLVTITKSRIFTRIRHQNIHLFHLHSIQQEHECKMEI